MPKLIVTPFAELGEKNDIPETGATERQLATMSAGFPAITQVKISEGGIPPERADFNGLGNLTTSHLAFLNRGQWYGYDATFASQIGGYPLYARLQLDNGDIVQSTIPNNTSNPNIDMTGWVNAKNLTARNVFDESGLNQQQWNNGITATTDLLTIPNPKNGNRVFVKSIQKWYTYNDSLTIPENGVTVVDKWEMDRQDYYYASWFATKNIVTDQRDGLQTGWDYASSKNAKFIFDGVFYVAQLPKTYSDGLIRKIGLQVPSNSETYFNAEASVKLIPNADPIGYVLNFYLAENFKMYNPVVYGDVDEHTGTTDESNHCFNIVNCINGYIHQPKAYNAWGDGLYVGTEYSSLTNKQCENVTIFEPYAEHCGRAGISVTSGINVNIYSPTFDDIFRVYPKVGINIEGEGIGACLPVFKGINVLGKITAKNCDIAASVYVYDSIQGDVDVEVCDVFAENCVIPVVTQLFAENSGNVRIGNITGLNWIGAVLKSTWSQRNCTLDVGNIYSINAKCNGTIERFSSVISMDIDAESQPMLNLGNVTIGDIYISDISTTKVMHPFYFKDNTSATDGARKLDKIRIGDIYGKTLNTAYYADGHVTSEFKFNLEYTSAYYLPLSRPFLYSKLKSVAVGGDPFTLTVSNSYKTKLTVQKYATGATPLRVILPAGSTINPPALGANNGLKTTVSGSSISIEWNGSNAFITSEVGTWNSY